MTPDRRRAVRTAIHTAGAIAMLGYLGWIIWRSPADKLTIIALGLVAILFVRDMLHGAENVTARLKFGFGKDGVTGEIDPDKKDDGDAG